MSFESMRISPEERSESFHPAGAIERLKQRYPQLTNATYGLVAMAAMLGGTPESEAQEDSPEAEAASIERVESIDQVQQSLETVDDPEFRNDVEQARKAVFNVDEDPPKSFEDPVYSHVFKHERVNGTFGTERDSVGELNDSASDIIIGDFDSVSRIQSTEAAGNDTDTHTWSGMKDTIYISESDAELQEGGTFTAQAEAPTRDMAIENALQEAVEYLGTTVSTETEMSETYSEQGRNTEYETGISRSTSSEAVQYVKQYEVTDHSTEEDDLMGTVHKVTVKVIAGVPTEEVQE